MQVSSEEQEIIQNHFSHYYVVNPKNDSFLERVEYRVELNQFHCYCYGNKSDGKRSIRLFQFLEMGSQGFHVYLQEEEKTMWVPDLVSLRRDIFGFVDQTSLFRSSFLYDSVEKKLFRLHYLHYFLYLPHTEQGQFVGFVTNDKKKQILKKLQLQYEKLQKSILL